MNQPNQPAAARSVRGERLYKLLHERLRIPRQVGQPALSAVKIACHPGQYRLRRRVAAEISAAMSEAAAVSPEAGYRCFGPDDYPGVRDIVAACTQIYEESRQATSVDTFLKNPKKRFLLSVLDGVEFCQHPELIRFMVSRPILDVATAYLGFVPLLVGAKLWWSPANDTVRSSQRFHLDYEDVRQLKVFINIFETAQDQGPLTFIPADVSEQIQKSIGRIIGRVDDDRVHAGGGRGQDCKLMGPPGSGAFVDTARCLHYGSRGNRRDRLILMFQFLTFHTPYTPAAQLRIPADLPGLNPDPVQELALGLK